VPEVVKTDVRQPDTLERGLEGAVAEVGRIDESSALCSEDAAAGLVEEPNRAISSSWRFR
jgi:hypothetical protein